jgi:AcrR family transcriptional regulator
VPRGRPRRFNTEEALDRALEVFWRKGYQGTSLDDLSQTMGINRPSLYAAFGSKEALFRKVLVRYVEGPAGYLRKALAEPTPRALAEYLLGGAIEMLTDPRNPRGCLIVQGALACGETAESVRRELVSQRAACQVAVCLLFEHARANGHLPADADPADLARFVMTVMWGMAVQAASGANREELRRVAEMALRTWPK